MAFVKKAPSNTASNNAHTSPIGDNSVISAHNSHTSVVLSTTVKFENVGNFLAWEPPVGAIIPKLKRWTSKVDDTEFQKAWEGRMDLSKSVDELMRDWISKVPPKLTKNDMISMRKSIYGKKLDLETVSTQPLERYKQCLLKNHIKKLNFANSSQPPYMGTWKHTDEVLSPCNPFGKHYTVDYEIDSDDEEFGGPEEAEDDGESIGFSGEEDEEDGADEYEFDMFTVPDGHFSDNELVDSDEDSEDSEKEVVVRMDSTELLKQTKRRLSNKNKKLTQLTPALVGIIPDMSNFESGSKYIDLFGAHSMQLLVGEFPVLFSAPACQDNHQKSTMAGKTTRPIPEHLLPVVAAFIHKEYQGSFDKLLGSLRVEFKQASKRQLGLFIRHKCEKFYPEGLRWGVWLIKTELRQGLGFPLEAPEVVLHAPKSVNSSTIDEPTDAGSNPGGGSEPVVKDKSASMVANKGDSSSSTKIPKQRRKSTETKQPRNKKQTTETSSKPSSKLPVSDKLPVSNNLATPSKIPTPNKDGTSNEILAKFIGGQTKSEGSVPMEVETTPVVLLSSPDPAK